MPISTNSCLFRLFLFLLTGGGIISTAIYVPALPNMAHELQASAGLVQASLATFFLGIALSQFIFGPASDAKGRLWITKLGFLIFMVGSLCCWLAQSIDALLVGRFIQGLGAGVSGVITRAMARDAFDEVVFKRFIAHISIAMAVFPMLAPAIGGYLTDTFDWRTIFIFLLGYGGVILVFLFTVIPETLKNKHRHSLKVKKVLTTYLSILKHQSFVGALLVVAFSFSGLTACEAVSPFLLQTQLGFSPTFNGMIWIGLGLVFIFGAFLHNQLLHYIQTRAILLCGVTISLLGSLVAVYCAFCLPLSLPAFIVPLLFYAFGVGIYNPSAMGVALMPFPHVAGSAAALIGCAVMLMASIASSIMAIMPDNSAKSLSVLLLIFSIVILTSYRMLLHRQLRI